MGKRVEAAESEYHEAPKTDYSLSFEHEDEVLENLTDGHHVNFLVSMSSEVVLSMDTHIGIQKRLGLNDDQILLEGQAQYRHGRIYIDLVHGATELGRKEADQIENKINDELLRELNRLAA
jgi:hypothetical protein